MVELLDKCKAWFDDPENVKSWENKIKMDIERENRYINKIASLSKEQRSEFIQKCIDKYESEEYRYKEYNLGREPNCSLYYWILAYAEQYGEDCYEEKDFLTERFKIDNEWIIELYQGQGSFICIYNDGID